MTKFKPILGIDLGTTNSCVAYSENGKTTNIITYPNGQRTLPSIVLINEQGESVEIGQKAKDSLFEYPEKTINAVKRFMGRTYDELSDLGIDVKNSRFKIAKGPKGEALIEIDGKTYSPINISAMLLSYMKKEAERYVNMEVTEAVITVPAYFNDAQRQATKDAATIAGLQCKRVINEPTAAALAYGIEHELRNGTIIIYDLGGGTFDATCLKIEDSVYEVLSTHGNTHLGGEDIDKDIAELIAKAWYDKYKIELNKEAIGRIQEAAKTAKETCSTSDNADINLPFLMMDSSSKPIHFKHSVSRATVEKIAEKYILKTKESVDQVLKDANQTISTIDKVILVGGSTRIPAVQKFLKSYFNKDVSVDINPDEAVAIGAALQAAQLNETIEEKGDVLLLDVCSLSLGLETQGGINTIMIRRNTTIPTSYSQVFSTAVDNQTSVNVRIFQGERTMVSDCHLLGEFELSNIKAAPRGVPQIEVTFDIDKDGIVNVSAVDKGTQNKQNVVLNTTTGLTKEQIDKMVQDAEAYKEKDELKARKVSLENQREGLIHKYEALDANLKSVEYDGVYNELKDLVFEEEASKLDEAESLIKKFYEILHKAESSKAGGQPNEENKE